MSIPKPDSHCPPHLVTIQLCLSSFHWPDSQATIVWTSVSRPTPALIQNLQSLAFVSGNQAEKELTALNSGNGHTDNSSLIFIDSLCSGLRLENKQLCTILLPQDHSMSFFFPVIAHHSSVDFDINIIRQSFLFHWAPAVFPRLSSSSFVGSPRLHTLSF